MQIELNKEQLEEIYYALHMVGEEELADIIAAQAAQQ